jgi:hypothetical protein
MRPIHDIRDQMPKFSANFFAPYVYQPYPRMMVNKETGKPYLDGAKKPIAVHSEEEEAAFWASKKTAVPVAEAAKSIEIPIAAVAPPVVRQQFEALTPKQAEKAAAANETVAPPKRRGRPPSKLPADLK